MFSSLLFAQPKQFQVKQQPRDNSADVNRISIHPEDMKVLLNSHSLPAEENRCGVWLRANGKTSILMAVGRSYVARGTAQLDAVQLVYFGLSFSSGDTIQLEVTPEVSTIADQVKCQIEPYGKSTESTVDVSQLQGLISEKFLREGAPYKGELFDVGNRFILRYSPQLILQFTVVLAEAPGKISSSTQFQFQSTDEKKLRIVDGSQGVQLLKSSLKLEELGIGGVQTHLDRLLEEVLLSRSLSAKKQKELGLDKPIKGMLLYGPPGTGKTLFARVVAKVLHAKEPVIVNGPEILSKYVGESEAKLREIFEPAQKDYKQWGDKSPLHIIVFDEIDSIGTSRGGSGDSTGVKGTLVNQLLTLMDGFSELNNILIFATTNRKDLMDPALLRPGRFTLQMLFSLPDEMGRHQILDIHLAAVRTNHSLKSDVDLSILAKKSENYSGAELKHWVETATKIATREHCDPNDPASVQAFEKFSGPFIGMAHFEAAFLRMKPTFGHAEILMPEIHHYPSFDEVVLNANSLVEGFFSNALGSQTLLVVGSKGSGKSALAILLCKKFTYFRQFSSEDILKLSSESARSARLLEILSEAKEKGGAILLEDIEVLLNYRGRGDFSRAMTQTLDAVLRATSTPDKKLFILMTTAQPDLVEDLNLAFDDTVEIPALSEADLQELEEKTVRRSETATTIREFLRKSVKK